MEGGSIFLLSLVLVFFYPPPFIFDLDHRNLLSDVLYHSNLPAANNNIPINKSTDVSPITISQFHESTNYNFPLTNYNLPFTNYQINYQSPSIYPPTFSLSLLNA